MMMKRTVYRREKLPTSVHGLHDQVRATILQLSYGLFSIIARVDAIIITIIICCDIFFIYSADHIVLSFA